jgi:hypothetical protein
MLLKSRYDIILGRPGTKLKIEDRFLPTGPYFEGQRTSGCRHYYPDVVRVKNIKIDKKYFLILHCLHCGYAIEEIQDQEAYKDNLKKGIVKNENGVLKDFQEFRDKEIVRMRKK